MVLILESPLKSQNPTQKEGGGYLSTDKEGTPKLGEEWLKDVDCFTHLLWKAGEYLAILNIPIVHELQEWTVEGFLEIWTWLMVDSLSRLTFDHADIKKKKKKVKILFILPLPCFPVIYSPSIHPVTALIQVFSP